MQVKCIAGQEVERVEGQFHLQGGPVGPRALQQPLADRAAVLHKVVGGLNSTSPGDVGAGEDLIDHQGKSIWVTACRSEDYVERLVKGSWSVPKWR